MVGGGGMGAVWEPVPSSRKGATGRIPVKRCMKFACKLGGVFIGVREIFRTNMVNKTCLDI